MMPELKKNPIPSRTSQVSEKKSSKLSDPGEPAAPIGE